MTNKGRYLEISSALCPLGNTTHIPSIKFDRIIKRNSFLNSGSDVNEHRFEYLKEPEIWTGAKKVKGAKIPDKIQEEKISIFV